MMENAGFPSARPRKRVCIVATVPFAIRVFMGPHVAALGEAYDVTLVSDGPATELSGLLGANVTFRATQIERKIAIIRDLRALFQLWRVFRRGGYDVVHSIMPKAGLLAMLAARAAGVPRRVHTFTGQVWATRRGWSGSLLRLLDRVLAANATHLLADGHSQRRFLIEEGVAAPSRLTVLADGSFAGVDIQKFSFDAAARRRTRLAHAIPDDAVVFMYLGRLNREKGLTDLAEAFARAAVRCARVRLFVVGPDEEGLDRTFEELAERFAGRVHRSGYTMRPEDYLLAADVLCLPSYREGFPNAPLQAAAIGIPTLGSRIYGITDAVEDGVTGVLHEPAAVPEIAEAMVTLTLNDGLRARLGAAAHRRVVTTFSQSRLTTAFTDYYRTVLLSDDQGGHLQHSARHGE
jgi:glycosyltransferase involved in cell wall biosynthesis